MIKKIPMRRCVGCMEGAVSLDFGGKKPGRGAYLCPDPECLAKAQKARRLERAFSCEIPAEVYERIGKELESHE